jgi:hypothetical protein
MHNNPFDREHKVTLHSAFISYFNSHYYFHLIVCFKPTASALWAPKFTTSSQYMQSAHFYLLHLVYNLMYGYISSDLSVTYVHMVFAVPVYINLANNCTYLTVHYL